MSATLWPRRRRPLAAAVLCLGVLLSSCGYAETPVPSAASSAPPGSTPSTCDNSDPVRSYAPSASTSGPTIQAIKKRGVLRVGVAWDMYRMGSRNPHSNQIEGFDIDLANAIAHALRVPAQLSVISAANRIPLLQQNKLDIVIRAFTINCDRWSQIAFSSEYFDAHQKVLVRKDLAADYRGPQDLAGLRVCAPAGTTSLDDIHKIQPKAIPVIGTTNTDCLMRFQLGQADAITGDDTVLAGLAAQDPYARIPAGQQPLEDEPYGVGTNKDAKDLVSFINHVIAQYEASGQWRASYNRWLARELGPAPTPPKPEYGR